MLFSPDSHNGSIGLNRKAKETGGYVLCNTLYIHMFYRVMVEDTPLFGARLVKSYACRMRTHCIVP